MPSTHAGHLWHISPWLSPLSYTLSQSSPSTQGRRLYPALSLQATPLARQAVPRRARKRARHAVSVHQHHPGHARARRRPVALALLSLSHSARMIITTTATLWTCSLARPSLVAVAMIGILPPGTVLVAEAPEPFHHALDAPATPRASPRRRLQDAHLALPFRSP
jgi:hypothetical protein